MNVVIRKSQSADLKEMCEVWNEIVAGGIAFPQTEALTQEEAEAFFAEQSWVGVAENTDTHEVLGLYILHPNNVGRCGHIANASYAVKSAARGLGIGEKLVRDSLTAAKNLGFRIMQFNAVVKTNYGAVKLYEKLGFTALGTIPGGFCSKSGSYEDIVLFYKSLS